MNKIITIGSCPRVDVPLLKRIAERNGHFLPYARVKPRWPDNSQRIYGNKISPFPIAGISLNESIP